MTLTVDRAGRLVLPKGLRERLGLRPGSALEVELEADGRLSLRTRPQSAGTPALATTEAGVLVHRGQAPADFDWSAAGDEVREERLRELAGGLLG